MTVSAGLQQSHHHSDTKERRPVRPENWKPVSLLCEDYKILSKALAVRLREVILEMLHVDQTYCVLSRRISDNIYLIWQTSI